MAVRPASDALGAQAGKAQGGCCSLLCSLCYVCIMLIAFCLFVSLRDSGLACCLLVSCLAGPTHMCICVCVFVC